MRFHDDIGKHTARSLRLLPSTCISCSFVDRTRRQNEQWRCRRGRLSRNRCDCGMFLRAEARERTTRPGWREGCLSLGNRSVWLGPDFLALASASRLFLTSSTCSLSPGLVSLASSAPAGSSMTAKARKATAMRRGGTAWRTLSTGRPSRRTPRRSQSAWRRCEWPGSGR